MEEAKPGFVEFLKMLYAKDATIGNYLLMLFFYVSVYWAVKWCVKKLFNFSSGTTNFIANVFTLILFVVLVVIPFELIDIKIFTDAFSR